MYGTPFLFLLTIAIFAFILWRRKAERALFNEIESLAKLGTVERLEVSSGFLFVARIRNYILRPFPVPPVGLPSGEVIVAWKPEEAEMVELKISPYSMLSLPKYIPVEILGKREWCEVRPIISKHAGTWHLARIDDEIVRDGRTRKIQRTISTRDFLVTGDKIGSVVKKVRMGEDEVGNYHSPSKGYLIPLWIGDGAEVAPSDVLTIMIIPTGRAISEKPN